MIVGKLQLVDNIKREIPDNATGQVSPRDVRQNLINIIDSVHLFTDDNYLDALNFSTPDTRTTRAGKEAIGKLHLGGYSSVDNSAFGYSALADNYDGIRNTAIGSHSMGCNVYGDSNSAFGFNSLAGNVFGSGNVALGNFTLQRSKFGSFNVAIGHGAGYYVGNTDQYKLYIGSHNLDEQSTCDNPLGSGLIPLIYGDMKNLRLGVSTSGLHNYGALQVSGDISPSQDCQHNLGHGSYRWRDLYLCNSINESVYFSGGYVGFGTSTPSGDQGLVTMAGHFVPSDDGIYALGHPDLRWDGYFSDISVSGTANIENAVYTNIEDCTYHCRTLYLASSGLCEDLWGESPCPYLHDEQIEGGGFVLQSSGVDYRRNYEFIFSAPDTTLTCLEEDTAYSRSAWNSNISIHIASGSHIKTDRAIGRDNLSLINDNCCYGVFIKKDTDGIREDRSGINEIQHVEVDATSGTFKLTFDGYETTAIPYNASGLVVQQKLEALTSIGVGNVEVFKGGSGTITRWEVRFKGTLGGQNLSEITCDGSDLEKSGDEECVITEYDGQNEIQKIIITADAGEWKLGHPTRTGTSECSTTWNAALGGYFTTGIPWDISASALEDKITLCFEGMLGSNGSSNVSVSLSVTGDRRTYTIEFINDLAETPIEQFLVDSFSLTLSGSSCEPCTNEKIHIQLYNAVGGTWNLLSYSTLDRYNDNCPFVRSADIPYNATAEEVLEILTVGGRYGRDTSPPLLDYCNDEWSPLAEGSWSVFKVDSAADSLYSGVYVWNNVTLEARISVTGQPGDWQIEFVRAPSDPDYPILDCRDILPVRVDASNLEGTVGVAGLPQYTMVRTHEAIDDAYNKIALRITQPTPTVAAMLDGVGTFRIGWRRVGGGEGDMYTQPFVREATIAEVMRGLNEALLGPGNGEFFVPYESPHIVMDDPVYGWADGSNHIEYSLDGSSVGGSVRYLTHSNQEYLDRYGQQRTTMAYNSRLNTETPFLAQLNGQPGSETPYRRMGWTLDGLDGNDEDQIGVPSNGANFLDNARSHGVVAHSFDILTHAGWYHSTAAPSNPEEALIKQGYAVQDMWLEAVEGAVSSSTLRGLFQFSIEPEKATGRARFCHFGSETNTGEEDERPFYDNVLDSMVVYKTEIGSNHPTHEYLDGSVFLSVGDGIVGQQGNWGLPDDTYPQALAIGQTCPFAGDLPFRNNTDWINSEASGPSYVCGLDSADLDPTAEQPHAYSTTWSWFATAKHQSFQDT